MGCGMDFVQSLFQWIGVTKQAAHRSATELYSVIHSIYPENTLNKGPSHTNTLTSVRHTQ